MKRSADLRIGDLVLHNDHQLIAFNKPGGMPTLDDKTGDPSLLKIAQAYSKRNLFPVHRIDRPCSGIVIFAKQESAAALLSAQWKERTVSKEYLAIVPKGLPGSGTLIHVIEKKGTKSYASSDLTKEGQPAELSYRIVLSLENYDILSVETRTGFFHQIRAQLSAAGFPIKDDVKYGARRSNPERTIGLHCHTIGFVHPGNHEKMTLQCPPPDSPLWNLLQKTT